MAGSTLQPPGSPLTSGSLPIGYQNPALAPQGLGSADTTKQVGAPGGYKWDPVQQRYVRTAQSLGQDVGAFGQAALSGLGGAYSGASGSSSAPWGSTGMASMPTSISGGANVANPTGAGTIQSPTIPGTINTPSGQARVSAIQGPDTSAANAAAFGAAKDQVGLESRSALTGLAGAMAGRGIVGSGVEGRGQVGVINQGQQQLGDTSRQQAINDVALKEQNALASYQGDVTQRGQDISSLDTQTGQQITQRGQDIGAQEAATNSLVAQRAQDQALQGLEYQGGITQRGQNIGAQEAQGQLALGQGQLGISQGQLALQQQDLALKRQQAALGGLTSLAGPLGY